jgi:PAS domain S-box-containing protein
MKNKDQNELNILTQYSLVEALNTSENKYKQFLNSVQAIVFEYDNHGSLLFLNKSWTDLLGHSIKESQGIPLVDFIYEPDKANVIDFINNSLKKSEYEKRLEVRLYNNKNELLWFELSVRQNDVSKASVTDTETGTGILYDVSPRKEAEDTVKKYQDNLEKIIEEKTASLKKTHKQLIQVEKMASLGSLVAGVAHELNTPIGISITASSYLIDITKDLLGRFENRTLKKSELEKYFISNQETSKILLTSLQLAADLILSFKKVSGDQGDEEKKTFNLKLYLQDILTSLGPKLKRTSHQIELRCNDDIEMTSFPSAIAQIIINLVVNSLMHGFKNKTSGTITIEVSLRKNQVVIDYTDNGQGIPKNQLEKIYDPFFTTARGEGGTGLGLNIVFNTVHQVLNGTITCVSKANMNTTFTIKIPLTTTD